MDWKDYEQITKDIYEVLGKESGVKIECYGNSCKVTGKSGVEHQIDVLTNHSDGIHTYKTAVECKYWNQNINKDIIMKVSEIVSDAGLNKGIIVSKLGFTPDAIKFAEFRNIGLIELRELTEDDWKGRIKNISVQLNMLLPQIQSMNLDLADNTKKPDFIEGTTRAEFLKIDDGSGEDVLKKLIEEFQNELSKQDEGIEFEKTFKFDKKTTIRYELTKQEVEILGLQFKGVLKIAKNSFEINGEDHIWMIMKSIFEKKEYTISKNGEISERKSDEK